MNKGEVWFVEFPLEEDESKSINRPVIVLDENILGGIYVRVNNDVIDGTVKSKLDELKDLMLRTE